jgi:hypothetical protein
MKSPMLRLAAITLCATTLFLATAYANRAGGKEAATAKRVPPADELPALCLAAKAEFRPLSQADLSALKTELADAVDRLDRRLNVAGKNGANWKKYLQWGSLGAQLKPGKTPDLAVLDAVYRRYTAGYEGLELVWFLDVQQALRRYRDMARRVANPTLKTSYEKLLEFLAEHLQTYTAAPTAEEAVLIGQAVRELEEARQAPALVWAIRHHFLRPNLLLQVSADLVSAGIASPVDETAPVHEVILGTDIYGTGHTTGRVRVALSPNDRRGVIETVFLGTVSTRNIGYHGPVTIYSHGSTRVGARKRIWIDSTGLGSLPTASSAVTETRITDIQSRRGSCCVERIAWRRSAKQKDQAECIASRRAEKRLNHRIDQQAAEAIGRANQAFADKFRKPLLQRKLFPRQLRFTTTGEALHVVSLQADQSQLAAPSAPPRLPDQFDLALCLHESMINNLASSALAGMTLHDEAFEAAVIKLLGELPEQLKADEDQQGWGIAFTPLYPLDRYRPPISVTFADNGISVTVRGRTFYKGDESYPGMDVTAVYKIVKTQQGFNAVRQGDLQILPPGFVPASGRKLSPRQVVIRTLLQRRFEKIFKPKMMGEGFLLPGKWKEAGTMKPVQLTCENGWLSVAWRQAPADQTVAHTR